MTLSRSRTAAFTFTTEQRPWIDLYTCSLDLRATDIHCKNVSWYDMIQLMAEILDHLIWHISHCLQGFTHPRWCRISAINSSQSIYHGDLGPFAPLQRSKHRGDEGTRCSQKPRIHQLWTPISWAGGSCKPHQSSPWFFAKSYMWCEARWCNSQGKSIVLLVNHKM